MLAAGMMVVVRTVMVAAVLIRLCGRIHRRTQTYNHQDGHKQKPEHFHEHDS